MEDEEGRGGNYLHDFATLPSQRRRIVREDGAVVVGVGLMEMVE